MGDRLERAGFPLRCRSLLFHDRPLAAIPSFTPAPAIALETVSPSRFRSLRWRANPGVREEAADFRGTGTQVAIAAVREDEMLGFCWLEMETADLRFLDVEAAMPAGMAYLSRVWVGPSSRGSGLGRALIERAAAEAATLGYHEIVSACVPANERMRHLFAELGWMALGRVGYLRAGPAVLFEVQRTGAPVRRARSTAQASRLIFAR